MSLCLLLQKKADACRVSHFIWSQKINSPHVIIRESGKFLLEESGIWNLALESLILFKESGIQTPLKNNPDSISWNPESIAWNPESKTV